MLNEIQIKARNTAMQSLTATQEYFTLAGLEV